MRFSGFSDLWKKSTIEKNAKVYDGTHQTPIYTKSGVKFVSVENINDLYSSGKYISVDDYNSDFKYVPEINDILMTRIGDIGTPALVTKSEPLAYYVSLALLKEIDLEPHFLYHYIQTAPFQKEVWRRTLHVAFPKKINKNEIGDCAIFYPSTRCEQKKIALFLDGIEKRIKIQNKIIKEYKSYRNRILHTIYNNLNDYEYLSLNQVCNITTRKLDANAMNPNGKYKFFTCAKEDYYIDTYSFDGESLIISGNGEVGLIKYFVGKFDAYQRTYVLQNFTKNPLYIKVALEIELPKKLHREKNVGAMPYMVLSTLSDIKIKIPNKELVSNIALIVTSLDKKIAIEEKILNDYISQKKYLLSNMFI